MSTYRYRGDLRTTGDQLRLRDGGSDTSSSVEIKAGATASGIDVVITTPPAPVDKDDVNITDDVMVLEDTKQTLSAKTLVAPKINDTTGDNTYTVVPSELTLNVNATLPDLTEDDEFTFNLHPQTLENKTFNLANNTLSGTLAEFNAALLYDSFAGLSAEQTLNNKSLVLPKIKDFSLDNTYNFTVDELSADTEVHLPALTANDEFTFNNHAQTLENKTIKDLEWSQTEFNADTVGTSLSLSPITVGLKIINATEDAKIESISSADTKYLILTNGSATDIQIANNAGIITGSGGDVPLPAGASTSLVYDGLAWRVLGKTGFDGGLALTSISSSVTAEVGKHYLVDSSAEMVTITLPSIASLSPSEKMGATIRITDAVNVAGTLSGSLYPNQIVIQRSGTDTINAAESTFSASKDWSALTSINLNVSGIWVQFMARDKGNGTYEWTMDDPFFNQNSELVSQEDIANLITLKALSASNNPTPSGSGSLSYNNTSGVFTYTPPDTYTKDEANDLLSANSSNDRNRANHTGTQLASTIFQFGTEVANTTAVAANTAKVSADGSINTHSDVDTVTAAPATGDVLKWNGSAWVPGVAGVEIISPSPATITASIASHYVLNTSDGAYTITLPDSASLSASDKKVASIRIVDSGNNADVNNITINASGSDTILLGELYTTGAVADEAQLVFDVPGKWIQLTLSGTKWVVEGTFI